MRVFVTGSTGFVGSAVVRELLDNGHKVLGLARSDVNAAALAKAGAEVHRGSLTDLECLRSGAAACDGVIHLAFGHDFSKNNEACNDDRLAIEVIGEVLEGSDRPFIVTSGTMLLPHGQLVTEDTKPAEVSFTKRGESEAAALALAKKGVRVSVMRLPPTVHGEGEKGFIPILIEAARSKGVAAYVDEGSNCWPAVHRFDAAHLYRLALELAPAGSVLHSVGEEGVRFREIAETIGKHLELSVKGMSMEETQATFGPFMAAIIGADNPSSAAITREMLGWKATNLELIKDIEGGHYFIG